MAEFCEPRRPAARVFARAFLALALAAVLLPASALASASTQPRVTPERPLPIPGAFRLAASNGYTLDVIAAPPRAGRSGSLLILANAKGKGVRYVAPATVTETSMQSDLGALGEISLTFHRSNQATSVSCRKETIRFDSGLYEGKIRFQGEEGYTSVEAAAVPGSIDFFLQEICSGGIVASFEGGLDKRPRGAALYVRNPALGPELSVRKRRPGAAAQIAAGMTEYTNGISIERFVGLRMP